VNCTRFGIVMVAALTGLGLFAGPASAQTTYNWNNSNTDPTSASSWTSLAGSPGVPGSSDTIQFNTFGTFGASTIDNPSLPAPGAQVTSATISNNALFQGWTFSGSSAATLVVGNVAGSTGLTTYGAGTYTINGPSLVGAGSTGTGLLAINVNTSSTLILSGSTAVAGNQGNISGGGTLVLDNSGTSTSRLGTTGTITLSGGGTLELIGNASSPTTQNVGTLNGGNNVIGGVNSFVVSPNGTLTKLVFANSGTGFSTRPGTRGIYDFVATSGNLGDANGGQITFVGTPFLGANGLLSNTSGGGTFGYAIVTDGLGTNFATWTSATGVISAANSNSGQTITTVSDAVGLASLTATKIAQFNPAAGGTVTASGTVTTGSLRITPAGPGATLAMGANGIASVALMLDGPNNFAITGTGTFGASGTRYIYVNNPNATLQISLNVDSGANPTVFGGPGFVELTGTTLQNTNTDTSRFSIAGGVVRANNTEVNFKGTNGVISFGDGVLEIKNGSNGSGANADFTRPITNGTAAAGSVTWGAQNNAEIGSGGFSAFGSNASVNIGGASAMLTWNQRNFVGDGYALKFGSTQSNAVLQWQNSIALDGGTAGNYFVREINVTAGTGGDKTQMTGIISGSSSTDLLKTGTGTLELLGMNTYQGNTLIQGGTLIVGNGGTIGTNASGGTGNIVVGSGATLAGVTVSGGDPMTIFGNGSSSVIVNPGGAIRGGNPTFAGDALGVLSTNSNIVINSSATANGILRVEAARTGANAATSSLISTTTGIFNLNPGGNKFTIDLVNNAASPLFAGESYTITLASVGTAGNFQLNGSSLGANAPISASNYTLQSSAFAFSGSSLSIDSTGMNLELSFTVAPVPEPTTVLAIAAGALGLGGLVRRRRLQRVVPTIAA
jgi:fibronectin-binding autotransporter adhesin